jgi:hypothetical protein
MLGESVMSRQELQELLAALDRVRQANTGSPEAARQFLKDEGFLTAEGEIAQPYEPLTPKPSRS